MGDKGGAGHLVLKAAEEVLWLGLTELAVLLQGVDDTLGLERVGAPHVQPVG